MRMFMRNGLVALGFLSLFAFVYCAGKMSVSNEGALAYCANQVRRSLQALDTVGYSQMPRNILEGQTQWNTRRVSAEEWCSGFWPGVLWMTYEATGDTAICHAAVHYTESLDSLAYQPAYDHDLGFIIINSFLKGIEALQHRPVATTACNSDSLIAHYRSVALAAADTLATLFNPTVGTMLSWPRHVKDYGGHNTIMDNMMNLELLFWAAENGGKKSLRDIAIKHAETTMLHHFRPDGSCYHVAVYDTLDGHFLRGVTHQGYSDSSMWSRGQSWAVNGYTMVYRFTHDDRFLQHAQKVTDIYIQRLLETNGCSELAKKWGKGIAPSLTGDEWSGADLIPRWDMDAPDEVKDASAACVVASALFELSAYVPEQKGALYRAFAEESLRQLSTHGYQSGERNVAFLMHSTGHHPAGSEIDASIVYADYYYIEALLRQEKK